MDFVTFSLIIDDIVFPDGQTAMGMLGGGGPQTAFGMKLWADAIGLSAGVGADCPVEAMTWLNQIGIDPSGLRPSTEWPTARAWQVCEADGRRTQVWRIPGPAIGVQLGRSLDKLPPAYRQAKGYHLGVHPEEPDLDFIYSLKKIGAVVSVEPFRGPVRPLSTAELQTLVSAGDIFSPNQAEAEALVGPAEPLELLHRLAEAGAGIVALRQGALGTLAFRADTGETWHIPAVNVSVVDPTGAGNAFCGGFLAGWAQFRDLRLAGLYGAVAASFMLEQIGLPALATDFRQIARQRLAQIEPEAWRIR
jgi:sugar/nucleoside kinase (ribokinase family)